LAAQQCIPLTEKKVVVIPTATVPQGITAAITFDETADDEANAAAMSEAAAVVHTAQVTYAARDSEFDGKSIRAGEYLSLLDGALCANADDLQTVLQDTLAKIGELEPELVSVYYGTDADDAAAEAVGAAAEQLMPDAEVSVLYGGQPVYYYVISAE